MDHGSHIPGAFVRVIGFWHAVRTHLALRRPVHDNTGSARQGYHTVHERITPSDNLQHHVPQAAYPEYLLFQLSIFLIRPVRIEQLQSQLSGVRL